MISLNTFLLVLAYNLASSGVAYVVVYFLRRNERELTALRGTAVALIGWAASSLIVLVVYLLFGLGGIEVRGGEFEGPISIIVSLAVMYVVFGWLSKKRTGVAP